ncbi:multicopper oxidase family protein [Paenibacillus sp. sptzw28]|uniref:multicopper oxidase family protein n=1 Tax=Paenibacillus sp. sptzw28 TaxID=715179 RepID=UPI001C6E1DEE|nr:multicopper oxidase family protein [Paenibacillus sp. sptzw28]QYR21453.1 multicopper oxidase family protein [Paenibacillus sp. sptzw28]
MYTLSFNLEMISLLFLVLFAWIGGRKASRLSFIDAAESARRRPRKLLSWAVYVTLTAALAAGANIFMAYSLAYEPLFWIDRLLLHLPLIIFPVIAVWALSIPKLQRLRRLEASAAAGDWLAFEWTLHASNPALAAPFKWTMWGGLAAFFFNFRPPFPFEWGGAGIPVLIFLTLCGWSWFVLARRSEALRQAGVRIALRPLWQRLLRRTATLTVVAAITAVPFTLAMQNSRLPDSLDMMSGPVDYGNGAAPSVHAGHSAHGGHPVDSEDEPAVAALSVASLTGPRDGKPDRSITLTAERKTVKLSSGKAVDAWTYNGQIPGPELRFKEGELVEVTLVNKDIEDGATIHWHGLDVPNAEDGVAGLTQDAVMPGKSHTYRFRAEQVGTFWYHSHQNSKEAVSKGLFGALVVEPADSDGDQSEDITVITHNWEGASMTIGSFDTVQKKNVAPGTPVRMRLINTDDWVRQIYDLAGTPFRVAAIDGTELNEPGELENARLVLTTGGRYDLTFVMPEHPVYLSAGHGGSIGMLLSPNGEGAIPEIKPVSTFDPLHYGRPERVHFGPDSTYDQEFTMVIDNKVGFFDGQFDMLYTLGGEVFPNTPSLMVQEGELIKTTIINRSAVDHPMHLHGHHVLVLSRNGKDATGSPWWSDTLDVQPGDRYEVAFAADNPGLWMDHCHNLQHAAIGMTMHLMYEGVSTPYQIGRDSGNHPE